ncbi:Origin recognition complex subunit 4 OS=Bos taurus GN=ORC4 PE=2 SV=1 [Rhizoctonia solani AG-1 IB]|uniref:Origin recognition complex subunit 4 n=1 Tax=Thanatephorus cucumeris (strain AG1-IB / isolate 7/3/14) TaxID=1108050 RepID=A0A0B7FC75_THACB|nr:Origin recognition complex subunit 4 OS=Bos taurus GN=ORC4 PE=2 SV=1 [Rhizoctonia solani AG-1 IB]
MSSNKRKFEAVTPIKATPGRSASVSSRGSYRTRPESDNDEEDMVESPEIISKKPKLFSTPSKSGRGKKKQTHANSEVDEIDFILHPESPGPTPSKTPRTRGGKTPRTARKAAPNITIVSRPSDSSDVPSTSVSQISASTPSKSQRRNSPSKRAAKALDLDATPRADPTKSANVFSGLVENPFIGVVLPSTSSGSPLKPAIPGAARGRKKVPTRQLVRDDSGVQAPAQQAPGSLSRLGSASGSSAANTDEEDLVPISFRTFASLKTGTTPKKPPTSSRKLHASPNKQVLANGDVYVDYMVPMPSADDDAHNRGISSGDEGAYISSSAEESEGPRSPAKGRNLFGRTDSYSLASRQPPSASRASSASRPPSLYSYDPSSPYTSRGPSPSPSFPNSQFPSESETEESDGESIYSHHHHVDPTRHLDKLASLARMALASAEDMRKKGMMREDEAPLPKCFLAGVVVERGKSRTKAPQSPSKKDKARASETEGEDGEEPTVIRAIPERRLGQVEGEPLARSRSWLDTVLGPSSQPGISRQTSSSSIATELDNPFDNSQTPFRRTNSQPTLPINVPKRPDLAKSLASAQSEPTLETVLAAYDMTPSRARTIHMTPSKTRLVATPSHTRLFGSPSKRSRMKEVEEVEEHIEDRPIDQGFAAWLSKQQTMVLRALHNPPWAPIQSETSSQGPQSTGERTFEVPVDGEKNETEAVVKLRALLHRTVETGEGNSCLLVGPRGSGKTRAILRALRTLNQVSRSQPQTRPSTPPPSSPTKRGKTKQGGRAVQQSIPPSSTLAIPIVIRLSGHAQTNDRLAMREIARQLVLQSGEALDVPLDEEEYTDEGPTGVHVPAATHLPQIVGALARQIRPVIVILDAFDLFAEHARQALLYCLLDTVQSCRAGQGSQGLAVVGVTSRIDCLTMLEKRVKSRFSHRIIRVSPPSTVDSYIGLMTSTLAVSAPNKPRLPATPKKNRHPTSAAAQADSWYTSWRDSIDRITTDRQFKQIIEDIFDLSRDVRLLLRILSGAVANLTPSSPWLTVGTISRSIQSQCAPLPFVFLQELAYPCVALLVATQHVHDRGHDIFTLKMLCDEIKRELGNEAITKALVQVQGRGLGLMRVPESVLEAAFERLVAHNVVVLAGPGSSSTGRAYVKYRCVPDRSDIKEAVERLGHSAMKRWFIQGASN